MISSYLIATGETWWRGIVLSFASALLQAVVAVAFVGIAAIALNATAATMRGAIWYIEVASYALIALIGARLLWVKGGAFLISLAAVSQPVAAHAPTVTMAATGITITRTRIITITTMRRPGATRTAPSPRTSPGPAVGNADCPR